MWDSLVNMVQGLINVSHAPVPFAPKLSLDWAKAGPPAPTGDPARDAQLLDNYKSGGWVTTTITAALPFGAEGLLDSALAAFSKLPALEGMGMGGGGKLISATDQWLSSFRETTEALGPELDTSLNTAREAVQRTIAGTPAYKSVVGTPAYKSVVGVERTFFELTQDPHYVSLGRELSFDVMHPETGEWIRLRFDELFVAPEGNLLNAESKFGLYADFTSGQRAVGVPMELDLTAIPTDASAARTGLTAGEPVTISVKVFKWAF
jgi:hypothetical protein